MVFLEGKIRVFIG
ncbi:hypothetical protein F8388_009111 [Cannabis sativa]|nr:hypothetical protein G4B88_003695 [Cannabis sativa]KAF4383080.1 hypothetical protein F8388_009111 [Cannabis sativa]